jgi:hypothetical protein
LLPGWISISSTSESLSRKVLTAAALPLMIRRTALADAVLGLRAASTPNLRTRGSSARLWRTATV